jgi:hypothetical protein
MAETDQQQQNSTCGIATVNLPPFWKNSPASWFLAADAQFAMRNVMNPVYYLVVAALSEHQVDRVKNIVEADPNETSFQRIRDALVSSNTLTPFQQVDRIVTMDQLNGRKPSELLTEMEKFRPAEDHHFFAYHFLQRMPREVRILLARDDCKDMRALAEKADSLMALQPASSWLRPPRPRRCSPARLTLRKKR